MSTPEERISWLLSSRGLMVRREYKLPDGGRLDLAGLSPEDKPVGVEVKRSLRDWHRDIKWPRYLPFVRELWVAFPENIVPTVLDQRVGILAWNDYSLLLIRQALTLRFPN